MVLTTPGRRARTWLVLAGACLSAGCSRVWLPEKLEKEAGRMASKTMLERFPEDKNPEWHDYVDRIGRKIARVSERPDFDYRFYVVDAPIVNAFSLPDGSILVTTGLLKLMKGNELALAGVIAHEIGHTARRHSAEQLQAQLGYRGASFFFFGFHTTMASRGAQIATQLADLGYGRDMELEADLCAVRYLSRLGYPPASTVAFLRKLRQTETGDTSSLVQTLQNHPPVSERLQYAQAYIHRVLLHESPAAAPAAEVGWLDKFLDPFRNYFALVYETQGIALSQRKAYDPALVLLTKSIAAAPRRASLPNTYAIRASVYLEKNDYADALADYAKSIELNPWDPKPYFSRGAVYARTGDYDRAIAEYTRAVDVDPDFAKAYHSRALAHFRKKDMPSSIADDTRALELDEKDFEPLASRGWAYLSLKDYDHAIDDFGRAVEHDAKDLFSRTQRGNAYLGKRDFDRALADFSAGIDAVGNDPSVYLSRARAYIGKKDAAAAIADADKALALDPKRTYAYVVRGFARVVGKDYAGGVDDCTVSIERSTASVSGYHCRALAYRAEGQFEKARADAAQSVALSTASADSRASLAWADLDSGRYPSALRGFQESLKLDSNPDPAADCKIGIALALLKQKKRAAAVAEFRAMEKDDPALADGSAADELAKRGSYYTDKERKLIEALAALARGKRGPRLKRGG